MSRRAFLLNWMGGGSSSLDHGDSEFVLLLPMLVMGAS